MNQDRAEHELELSIIIPALNEAATLPALLTELARRHPQAELLVVDDGSTDDTATVATAAGARAIRHPYRKGNGAAVKTGARAARGRILVFMDGDGQHPAAAVAGLLEQIEAGHDMVVGARSRGGQASALRLVGNGVYNRMASWIVKRPVADLTSGFRAVRAEMFREFLPLFPNGFSYPTTITMAFFRAGYSVAYVPVEVAARVGRGHLRVFHDGVRFALIIFRIGTLYSPLKLFFPVSAVLALGGLGNYALTFLESGRFTNMSALMLLAALLVFLIGLISEQIVMLLYRRD